MNTRSLCQQYKTLFSYLRSQWQWCLLSLLLVGEMFLYAWLNTNPSDQYGHYITQTIHRYSSLFAFIFWENLKSSVLMILAGSIPFGFGTLFSTYMVCTGLVATAKWLLPDVGVRELILCTLPHGIFELTAICFSVFLSVLWCKATALFLFRILKGKPEISLFIKEILLILRVVVFVQLSLILNGAILELTLSYLVYKSFL